MITSGVCLQGGRSDSVPGLGGGPLKADGQTISDVKVLPVFFHCLHLPPASLYICKFIEKRYCLLLKLYLLTLHSVCLVLFSRIKTVLNVFFFSNSTYIRVLGPEIRDLFEMCLMLPRALKIK